MRARTAVLAAALLATSGCSIGQLSFHNDHRLSFSTPAPDAVVTQPLTVSWSMRGFDATGLDGSDSKTRGVFAVFVDAAPMAVGKDLKSLAGSDRSCQRNLRCPDAKFLADRGVYLTTQPTLTVTRLPEASVGVGNEQHYVNVVLLDGKGRRLQESSWYLPFQLKRRSS